MPLVGIKEILVPARQGRYGVLSLLGGNLEMAIGQISAAEERRSPLILAFNQEVTPEIPLELGMPMLVRAAKRARVPVATILDHGENLDSVLRAIELGSSSVMFDGSTLPYEENVRQTREVVRVAHALGVDVEAELGSLASSVTEDVSDPAGEAGPARALTDPDMAADFCSHTGVDALAISFGNVHGAYRGEPALDLERVRHIHARVPVPLVMHGASGLQNAAYRQLVDSGISKVCYYTAAGQRAGRDLAAMLRDAGREGVVYHQVIARSIAFFQADTQELIDLLGCAGTVSLSAPSGA